MRGGDPTTRPQWAVAYYQRVCQGNMYATTIWVINSAIVKLGKLTVQSKVYRGVSGRGMPSWTGVDVAFLSTTRDRQVALSYAKSQGSEVRCAISTGQVAARCRQGRHTAWRKVLICVSVILVVLPMSIISIACPSSHGPAHHPHGDGHGHGHGHWGMGT